MANQNPPDRIFLNDRQAFKTGVTRFDAIANSELHQYRNSEGKTIYRSADGSVIKEDANRR